MSIKGKYSNGNSLFEHDMINNNYVIIIETRLNLLKNAKTSVSFLLLISLFFFLNDEISQQLIISHLG